MRSGLGAVAFAVSAGGAVQFLVEAAGEVELIVEADEACDLVDGEGGLDEESAGFAESELEAVSGGGDAHGCCPAPSEGGQGEAVSGDEGVEVEGLVEVGGEFAFDEVDGELVVVLGVGRWGGEVGFEEEEFGEFVEAVGVGCGCWGGGEGAEFGDAGEDGGGVADGPEGFVGGEECMCLEEGEECGVVDEEDFVPCGVWAGGSVLDG